MPQPASREHSSTLPPQVRCCQPEPKRYRFLSHRRIPRITRTPQRRDRKSTRLNSSHLVISYAVFCLKKKKAVRHRAGGRYQYTYDALVPGANVSPVCCRDRYTLRYALEDWPRQLQTVSLVQPRALDV